MKRYKIGPQCAKCPWKVSANPHDIPNGYSVEKHKKLSSTISAALDSLSNNKAMACHETHEEHCVGWMHNQLGVGNNIGLRIRARDYDLSEMKIYGKQHANFKDTIVALVERK